MNEQYFVEEVIAIIETAPTTNHAVERWDALKTYLRAIPSDDPDAVPVEFLNELRGCFELRWLA